jgi:malonyl-CoA/methylmalonyl-CoA synthetase
MNSSNLYATFAGCFPQDQTKVLLTNVDGRAYTYADAERFSARVANWLTALGLQRGDRVTVQVEKSPDMLFVYLGVLRAGMVFHPLNTAYVREELEYFLQDATPSLVICDPSRRDLFEGLCRQVGGLKLATLDSGGGGSLAEEIRDFPGEFVTVDNEPQDMAALLYSSGTTGRPKGIMLSHENLGHNARVLRDFWGFTEDDVLLHALPIFHVHGLFVAIGCVLMSGARMRWMPAFDVAEVIDALPDCTVMMGVPTYYTRMLAEPSFGPDICARVRLFISGSAPLLADTFEEFLLRAGKTILERYGMSETGMLTSNPLEGERRAGTVGFPLPGVSVRVVGPDGKELNVGEVGAIQVKGANVFSGYWNLPEKTAEDFTEDGFFNTGDQGRFDADGYLSIVGRAKDMIITGGLNVYPKEIELLIDEIPGVRESAVIGVPHPDFGEAVTAVVVPEAGAELDAQAVKTFVKAHAANFKVPKTVHFVDSLPRNTMGKVQKNLLRDRFA